MRHLPTGLQLAGGAVLVVVAFALHVLAGGVALGVALLCAGSLLERPVGGDR